MDTSRSESSLSSGKRSPSRPLRSVPAEAPSRGVRALAADVGTGRASSDEWDDFEPRERAEWISRAVNFALAVVFCIIASPIMLVTAILIKLSSRGPIFYSQTRVGIDRRWSKSRALHERRREDLGGVPFTIYKFRSMRVDAESNGMAVWASKNDDRVTRIGNVLRASRIDELPQLLNVVRGDMNIVGPRPERPSIFVRLREQITEYPVRQRVRPGITGLAQVCNPYDSNLEDVRRKVAFDIEYMRRQSLATDVGIMLRTIPVMLFRIGGW